MSIPVPYLRYQSGFGNEYATEAVDGALPQGRNSPQRAPLALYPELISGTAFTAPRHEGRRSWVYRRQPSVVAGRYAAYTQAAWRTGADTRMPIPPEPMRWNPFAIGTPGCDFVDGMRTLAANGDAEAQTGVAAHIYLADRSMERRAFVNADGEMLLVPQQGRLRITTEMGRLDVAPGEIALLPRGVAFKVELPDGPSRGYVCENYGAQFRLPELGPIGSNGLANPRDFQAPVAACEDEAGAYELVKKFGGHFWRAPLAASPFNVVAWHGSLAPVKYDTANFMTIGSISFDHPDPSIFTVLTSPSDTPGTANCDFVIFPPRWLVMEDTFRPPWYHRNLMSEFMGLVIGEYDAKPEGFKPGGASLHNCMVPHGPDEEAFERASGAMLAPQKLDNTLAFMFESRYRFIPTEYAMTSPQLDAKYADCWAGLKDRYATMSTPTSLNATHDPSLRSWVASANEPGCDFPIQNLPFGRYSRMPGDAPRIGVAIGTQVLDLRDAGLINTDNMNALMAASAAERSALRARISHGLREGSAEQAAWSKALVDQSGLTMHVPCRIGDYTDFYTGIHHATTVGKLFRPDNPLLPNYQWVPIGYHGRGSSIGVSGQTFRRPMGQLKGAGDAPALSPSQRVDYELELGIFVGPGNERGEPIAIDRAEEHLFGVCLLNDWSARDVQAWEYQPLGPFLSKSFATTLSPWVVTMEALAPFRAPFARPADHPQPLPYLDGAANRASGVVDIALSVWLQTGKMRSAGDPAALLSRSGVAESAYWTLAQLVAHHTVNGCNLEPGDLFGSGTLSGPKPEQGGSLLELTMGGKQKITLPNGEERTFLQDGDTIILRGHCERPGAARIGLGEVSGTLLAARA